MRNRVEALVEELPGPKIGTCALGWQDVQQHARPSALPLTNNRKPDCGDQKRYLDERDKDQKVTGHWRSFLLSGMNPSTWGSGHPMVRVSTSPKAMTYISLIV